MSSVFQLLAVKKKERKKHISNILLCSHTHFVILQVDLAEASYKQAIVAANEAQENLMELHESAFNHITETATDAGKICADVSLESFASDLG